MIVVVGGPPGSGKTTAAALYGQTHGAVLVSSGRLFREMAVRRRMDLVAFGAYAERHHEVDRQLDETVLAVARLAAVEGRDIVVDGRIQAPLLRRTNVPAFCVYVTAPLAVRAKRIAKREGKPEAQAQEEILARERSERARYRAIYGIDLEDTGVYDLVIDSSDLLPDAIVQRIYEGAAAWAKA